MEKNSTNELVATEQDEQERLERVRTQRLNDALAKVLSGAKPPENLTVSQWADKKRRLSPETSAEPGPWGTDRTPYLREPMDAFTDPRVRHITMVAASQVGKSEFINNAIGYIIDQDPGSILFVHPTTLDAKEYSKLRIAPMIRDCQVLARKVVSPKSRDSGNTILQKTYPGGILTMCGSQEAHSLASKPIRYVFGDERDRWARSAGNEGDPWKLAMARQKTFWNAKSVEVSTPTVKGASPIADAFYEGTMERWESKCPHCGKYHEIVWDSIAYDYDELEVNHKIAYKVKNVWYVCPDCGAVSDELTMKRQPAKWVAEKSLEYTNGTRSFWLNAFVSRWAHWKNIVHDYLDARYDTRKMQVVYNTEFGQLWEDRGDIEDEDNLLARREKYDAELPEGVLVLTAGVDTQDDRLEYEVLGHGFYGETWGITKGVIIGRPDDEATWKALDEVVFDRVFKFESGIGLRVSMTFVDEGGHFTMDVRSQCRNRIGKKVFCIKGMAGPNRPFVSPPKKQKIMSNGRVVGSCWQYQIGVDAGKQIIMDNLRVHEPGPKFCHFPLNEEYNHTYFVGLLSERLVYMENKKQPWVWEKIPGHERNEPLDIRNYAMAAFKAMAVDMDRVAETLSAAKERGPVAVTTAPKAPQKKKKQRRASAVDRYYDDW